MRFSKLLALICSAGCASARHMTRFKQPIISLYSPNGRHLKISESGRVGSTTVVGHPLAAIKLVVVEDNSFYIKGAVSGRYVAEVGRGRLFAVKNRTHATRFTEAHLENFFNEYRLVRDEDCSLSLRKRGSVRIICNKKSSTTNLLPRRTHQHV